MKALGAEIKDFYINHWPKGYYHDDYDTGLMSGDVDSDVQKLKDSEKYDLARLGRLYPESQDVARAPISFSSAFAKWKRSSQVATVVVNVPVAKKDALVALLKENGYVPKG